MRSTKYVFLFEILGLHFASAGTLAPQWASCQLNLLSNPEFDWSNGTIAQWDIFRDDAGIPLEQTALGMLEQGNKGFRISGSGDILDAEFFSVKQSVELGSPSPAGAHYVLAVQAMFSLTSCDTHCRASVSLLACSDAECSNEHILKSDYRALSLPALEEFQHLHEASSPSKWHLLQVFAPAGTTHLHVELDAKIDDGTVDVTMMCLRKVSSFDALTWLMDRYYSHFVHNPELDWASSVQTARETIAGIEQQLNETEEINVLKPLLTETRDVHVYITDSVGNIILPTQASGERNIDVSILPTKAGALRFEDAGQTQLTSASLTSMRVGEGERTGNYLYVLSPSLVGGRSPDWNELVKEMGKRLRTVHGLILDLRANSGGDVLWAETITALLTREDFAYQQVRFRAGAAHDAFSIPQQVSARGKDTLALTPNLFEGPVAVLLGPQCVGACEEWASMLQRLTSSRGRLRSFGASTRGANGWPTVVELQAGASVSFSTRDVLSMSGESLEGVGVAPDVEVPWQPDTGGYAEDPILKAALEWLAFEEEAYDEQQLDDLSHGGVGQVEGTVRLLALCVVSAVCVALSSLRH